MFHKRISIVGLLTLFLVCFFHLSCCFVFPSFPLIPPPTPPPHVLCPNDRRSFIYCLFYLKLGSVDHGARSSGEVVCLLPAVTKQIVPWWSGHLLKSDLWVRARAQTMIHYQHSLIYGAWTTLCWILFLVIRVLEQQASIRRWLVWDWTWSQSRTAF